ncbi:hypothetical protein ACWM35_21305 [Neobacillus sp. K501]
MKINGACFFDHEHYKTTINHHEFQFFKGFGLLVKEYHGDLTYENGSKLFKDFLLDKRIV